MRFLSVQHQLPSQVVTNDVVLRNVECGSRAHLSSRDLSRLLQMTEAGFKSAGTEVRYHLAPNERPYEICTAVGRRALAEANVDPEDIDLLIYVGVGRGFLEPATANVFQDLLGLSNATCFDIVDACASWLRAFEIAQEFLASGRRYRTVMILNGEFIGRYAYRYELRSVSEFAHWFPGVTVGEAAAVTILTRSDDDEDFTIDFRNYGEGRSFCMIPFANYSDYLGSDTVDNLPLRPLEFISFGARLLRFGADKLVEHFKSDDRFNTLPYDIVFGHPASDRVCEGIGMRCGLDFNRFQFTHRLFGNTVSASLPLAISVAKETGRLVEGSRVLVLYASAGVSTALVAFRYWS